MKRLFSILIIFSSCTGLHEKNSKETKLVSIKSQAAARHNLSDSTDKLSGKIQVLDLNYIVWGCACANWITPEDFSKYQDSKLKDHCIFIEPAADSLELPIYFEASRHKIRVQGQFHDALGYPKGTYKSEEPLEKARVFNYTKIEVIRKEIDYPAKDNITLALSYGLDASGCSRPQWINTRHSNTKPAERYFLEPANQHLLNADSFQLRRLFAADGSQLKNWSPISIIVKGQFVSENGFPFGFRPSKEEPHAGKVFRYTHIQLVKS
ncbi:MAG: hypothetical protein JO301_02510 [Chitinophagaceae bacterium]|nr:hypothetical protein [Chitinophagaceae bacterium]